MEKHYIAHSMSELYDILEYSIIHPDFCMKIIDMPSADYSMGFLKKLLDNYDAVLLNTTDAGAYMRINGLKVYVFPNNVGVRIVIIGNGYCE